MCGVSVFWMGMEHMVGKREGGGGAAGGYFWEHIVCTLIELCRIVLP